mmetsp:Transcript_12331/g.24105  ORF Transcript_12331/g.24105 Transcript_12331/m.24105 type:complete len:378 (+) Transcript_12331:57-1190(+)
MQRPMLLRTMWVRHWLSGESYASATVIRPILALQRHLALGVFPTVFYGFSKLGVCQGYFTRDSQWPTVIVVVLRIPPPVIIEPIRGSHEVKAVPTRDEEQGKVCRDVLLQGIEVHVHNDGDAQLGFNNHVLERWVRCLASDALVVSNPAFFSAERAHHGPFVAPGEPLAKEVRLVLAEGEHRNLRSGSRRVHREWSEQVFELLLPGHHPVPIGGHLAGRVGSRKVGHVVLWNVLEKETARVEEDAVVAWIFRERHHNLLGKVVSRGFVGHVPVERPTVLPRGVRADPSAEYIGVEGPWRWVFVGGLEEVVVIKPSRFLDAGIMYELVNCGPHRRGPAHRQVHEHGQRRMFVLYLSYLVELGTRYVREIRRPYFVLPP